MLTSYSYACPQIFPDENSSGGTFPGEIHPPPSDEFKCLILQLNVPLVHLQSQSHSSSKLPVLVYIHGGGFVLGKIDPQHNTALLVEQSILDSQPIISASIQYRLGALGYLHTPEPETANLALNDQRNALYWIQRFVGGFGGDSARVTVFGESAGAISICGHMLAAPPPEGPLFTRVVLMSGIIGPSTAPNSVEKAEEQYEAFLERLGVQTRGEDGMQELRDMDVQRIVETSAEFNDEGSMWLSVLDREWFGEEAKSVTWDRIPELLGKCEWVDEVVLGTTSFEVSYARLLDIHRLTCSAGHPNDVPSCHNHTASLRIKHNTATWPQSCGTCLQSIRHNPSHGP
jgi:carboxylesterase type B